MTKEQEYLLIVVAKTLQALLNKPDDGDRSKEWSLIYDLDQAITRFEDKRS